MAPTAGLSEAAQDRALKSVDWAKAYDLKSKTLAQYLNNSRGFSENLKTLEADIAKFLSYTETLNLYPELSSFRIWWEKNKISYLKPHVLEKLNALSPSGLVTLAYFDYVAEKADKLDLSDPQSELKKKKGESTAGGDYFAKVYDLVNDNPMSSAMGVAVTGYLTFVGGKVLNMFVLGPGINFVNSLSEPIVRPALERISVLRSQHVDPWFVPWSQFVSGEKGKRKRALKASVDNKDMTGNLARYDHPAIDVKDFTKDNREFYDEMLKAEYKWRGWLLPEFGKARNTGWELIYTQFLNLSERLNGYQNAINTTELVLSEKTLKMREAGVPEHELRAFSALVRQMQEIQIYEDLRSSKLKELEAQTHALLTSWLDRGIDSTKINEFYDHLLQSTIAKNRPAFALGAFLHGEMYFQEFNTAVAEYKKIQEWQEQAREMTGFYNELTKHEVNIQKFFDKKGLKYNVKDRINQRGYPLGGPKRPVAVLPVGDCVKDFLKAAARASTP